VSPLEALGGRQVGQIGLVVRDLERSLERYSSLWGVGPWKLFTYGPGTVPTLTYRGRPGLYSMRIALAAEGPQLELIEPLTGPNIYEEWLDAHGEGVHHLGVMVPSLDEGSRSLEDAGYALIQSGAGYGLDGDGGYAYFDTEAEFGVYLELIEVPARRREPEAIWA
jgi:methylmalonyl-CoA/ethylmalonyl-CoA epimerase